MERGREGKCMVGEAEIVPPKPVASIHFWGVGGGKILSFTGRGPKLRPEVPDSEARRADSRGWEFMGMGQRVPPLNRSLGSAVSSRSGFRSRVPEMWCNLGPCVTTAMPDNV